MITGGSLFSGIGGFDLGFQKAGIETRWFCERDKYCQQLLTSRWRNVPCYSDIRRIPQDAKRVDALYGGDPCPSRSKARGNRPAIHPDLAGWFLAVVGRFRPKWVVRENVFASDALDFGLALEALGYGIASIGLDARDFTAQSRRRQFFIGRLATDGADISHALLDACDGEGFSASRAEETTPIAACLTAHPGGMAAEDSYVYEPRKGLRFLDSLECGLLQGFPRDWTVGFSNSQQRVMLGNAMNVAVAQWLGEQIVAYDA